MNRVYIDKLLEGDLSYFEEFYEETKYKVFYNILSIVKDEVSAEDILQETYLRFLNNLDKLKKEKNILGYLFVISRNISLDYIKKRNKEKPLDELTLSNIKDDEQSDYDDQIY